MFSHHEQTSLQRCIEREASITHLKQTISLHRFASATQKLIHFVAVEEHVPEHPATPGHHFHLLSISTVFRFELVMFGLRAFQCSFLAFGGFAGISSCLFSSHNFSGGLVVALHLGARLIGSCFQAIFLLQCFCPSQIALVATSHGAGIGFEMRVETESHRELKLGDNVTK